MDAKVAEIISKVQTAIRNVDAVVAAEEHAKMSGLVDDIFLAMTTQALELAETSTMDSTTVKEGLTKYYDLLLFLPSAEVRAHEAFKASAKALAKMQVAVIGATERKKARDEEAGMKRKTMEGEASNRAGGNNA